MFLAYRIKNEKTGAIYIGITSRPLKRRWSDHRAASKSGDTVLYRAIRKYGIESFSVEPIACCRSYADLLEAEKELIKQERSSVRLGGYNMTDGGDGTLGWVPSEETRQKLRAATTAAMRDPARRNHLSEIATTQWSSPESRAIISAANKGRKHTDETKKKVSEAVKRRPPRSQETCEKLAAALRGRPRPPEVRAKVSASKLGKKMSDEARRNMSIARKGKKISEQARQARIAAWAIRRLKIQKQKCG